MIPAGEVFRAREAAAAQLLLELGQALHAAAMPSDRVERRLRAVARGLGTQADVLVLQGAVVVESGEGDRRSAQLRRIGFDTHWNLTRLHALVDLCAALASGALGISAGRGQLDTILATPRRYAKWLVVLAYGVYSGVVAARVGGGALEVGVGAVIGLLAGVIHFGTIRYQRVDLQKSFLATLIGCLVAFLLSLVLPPFHVGQAVFGGITLLVPAMVLTIGIHELSNDALESGVGRLAYGLLRFLMLAFGVMVAGRIWGLMTPAAVESAASEARLAWPIVLVLVGIGGAALTVCLQGRWRDLPWLAGAALLAFGSQELTKLLFGERGSPLLAALVLGIAANLYGRRPGHVPATIIVPGLLQLAPGFLGTEAVVNLLGRTGASAGAQPARFFDVFMVALQLVMGLVLADVLLRRTTEARLASEGPRQPVAPPAVPPPD